jgi:hypothetical protein
MTKQKGFTSVELTVVSVALVSFAAWITHIVVCLKAGSWGFLIAGAILPPIGVIHGVGCWFGVW